MAKSSVSSSIKTKAPKGKFGVAGNFEKVLMVLLSGKVVSPQEIDTLIGSEIEMYRLSTYMWNIKSFVGGVIRPTKDGRKVAGYQLVNVKEMTEYCVKRGLLAQPVESLSDLKAEPVETAVEVLEVKEITEA